MMKKHRKSKEQARFAGKRKGRKCYG